MKTYEQRKAELNLQKEGPFYYISHWRYNPKMQYAECLRTGTVFKADIDTFLLEKKIIDMSDPVV